MKEQNKISKLKESLSMATASDLIMMVLAERALTDKIKKDKLNAKSISFKCRTLLRKRIKQLSNGTEA